MEETAVKAMEDLVLKGHVVKNELAGSKESVHGLVENSYRKTDHSKA